MNNIVSTELNQEKFTWSSFENLGNGIFVYHDVLTKDLNIVDTL